MAASLSRFDRNGLVSKPTPCCVKTHGLLCQNPRSLVSEPTSAQSPAMLVDRAICITIEAIPLKETAQAPAAHCSKLLIRSPYRWMVI
jgi:hypothetical protein